ncbi:hypothetical protein ACG873_00610 (plasmid) [Mesorhizobium sp. AaZ16]|jgi:hypothetical protein|uniref:hypothetical protein n=1 Tax=Mesorhizobium sp. AaZ16 TaxID=3402289 RepID=UPI00374E21E0
MPSRFLHSRNLHAVGLEANTSCGRLSITSCVAAGRYRRRPFLARFEQLPRPAPERQIGGDDDRRQVIVTNDGGIFDFSALCSDVVTRGSA